MTTLEIVLICTLFLTVCVAIVSIYFAIKFAMLILRIEDALEETLDILDTRYASISEIVEIPLFSDSPQIRQVHQDLKYSRDSLLSVANILVNDFNHLEKKDTDNAEEKKEDT